MRVTHKGSFDFTDAELAGPAGCRSGLTAQTTTGTGRPSPPKPGSRVSAAVPSPPDTGAICVGYARAHRPATRRPLAGLPRDDGRMRRVLIANPAASRVTEARLAAVAEALAPVDVLRTERLGHGVDLAREAGAAELFVLGGDGSFNEALNGCADGAVLGFLPAGGTNVLPRALGLP